MQNFDVKVADSLFERVCHGDKNAFHELEQLAENGNAHAMSNLARIYLKSLSVAESSYKKALDLFRKAADLNDVEALFRLGEFYRDAKYGLEQDGHKAAEYFLRAAEHGDPSNAVESLNCVAEIYRYGKGGVQPDGQKAVELYEKLAELESPGKTKAESISDKAVFKLAEIYTEGCGNLKPNAKKAVEYLNKAYDKDRLEAAYKLAEFYRLGKAGIKPDGYKVIKYLRELGGRHLTTIAEIYRDGKYNVKADGHKAIEYLVEKTKCKTCTLDTLAGRYLRNYFDDGENVTEYYSEAQEICNVHAFHRIAEIYLEGKGGVRPDGYKALEYFSKAVESIEQMTGFTKNFIDSDSNLKQNRQRFCKRIFRRNSRLSEYICEQIANIYSEGKAGVQPDGGKAVEYLLKAINCNGNNPGEDSANDVSSICNKIAWIYLEGKGGVQPDGYKAIHYFDKGSAFETIAEIYRYGKAGVTPDPQKALEYFFKHEATIPHTPDSSDAPNDLNIYLDKSRRADVFRKIAEIYSSVNDGRKALEYFLKADECGDEWAYIDVEKIYREGKGDLKSDGIKLIEYLTKKLAQDESDKSSIIYDLAEVYESGCGSLEPNMQKALELYGKSAALGNHFAKRKLEILTGVNE